MPARPRTLDESFDQGVAAREAGRNRSDNPYDIDTDEHREWAAGWSATLDLDEDQNFDSSRIVVGNDEGGETG